MVKYDDRARLIDHMFDECWPSMDCALPARRLKGFSVVDHALPVTILQFEEAGRKGRGELVRDGASWVVVAGFSAIPNGEGGIPGNAT